MRIHGRTRALIGVLATAFVVAIPGTAFAGHDLGIYKVEKQVDLNADDFVVDLSCKAGDYALDGMWRIDHADQDDDDLFITSIGRAVDVQEAYPYDSPGGTTHLDSYHFVFNKNAIGRAQVKVFATCLAQKTAVDGHQHQFTVTPNTPVTYAPGAPVLPVLPWTGQATASCPANTFISTTGYKITPSGSDPVPYVGHLSESWPTAVNAWSWKMDLSQDAGATVTFYSSCVSRKVPLAGGEKHKLVYRLQGPEVNNIPAKSIRTKRISCKSHYKAVVAGFSFTPGAMNDPNPGFSPALVVPQLWYLGMDPQPKSRDFRFLNSDPGSAHPVSLKAICLNYRTT